jgi:hypothetical protein
MCTPEKLHGVAFQSFVMGDKKFTHCCIHEGAEVNAPPQASRKMEENLNLPSLLLQ